MTTPIENEPVRDDGLTLGIDTSGAVSIAVARGTEVLSALTDERARHHDEVLLPMIDRALLEAGGERSNLVRVVAGRGPGPFTGIRVGLVTARTIATTLGLALVGLSSLEALAFEAAEAFPDAERVAVALDARRREVYWGLFAVERAEGAAHPGARQVTPVTAAKVGAPADVGRAITEAHVRVGSGALMYPEVLQPTASLAHVDAGMLIRAAASAAQQGRDLSSTEPLYVREPDAAKPTRRKSALGLGDRPA